MSMADISKEDLRKEIDGNYPFFILFIKRPQIFESRHAGDLASASSLFIECFVFLFYHVMCFIGILEGADLDTLSSKKVRQQLEEKLKFDLSDRYGDIRHACFFLILLLKHIHVKTSMSY
jgi:hypothetical protein